MPKSITSIKRSSKFFAVILLAITFTATAFAQSMESDFPTPVTANEVSGHIAARDVGDARLTRYFYIFSAAPGDLLITVESSNLNGDVDLFTAGTLRPLAKVSVYAGESDTKATKSVFLKQRQQIILRIEARSANDNEGSYRIRFEGSFEPLPDNALASNSANAQRTPEVSAARSSSSKRVSATGARLPDEPKEAANESQPASPQPAPSPTAAETANGAENAGAPQPVPVSPAPRRATPANRRLPRNTASTRAPGATNARNAPPRSKPTVSSTPAPAAAKPKPVPTARKSRPVPDANTERPAIASAPPARLVIEFRNGVKTERLMTTVRRVTIDNNFLVIINRDGKIERQQLSDVLRFAIEP